MRARSQDAVHKHGQKLQEISVDHNMVLPGMSRNLGEAGKILATAGKDQ